MKTYSIKYFSYIITLAFTVIAITTTMHSCKVSQKVAAKPGVQLWAENCQRCHNTPPANTFSPEQWETIGMHMQTRSLITDDERNKIVAFLKQ
jgi:cytochrome c2